MSTDAITDIFGPAEDLDPELVQYMGESYFGPCIQHPLVYSVPHFAQMNGKMNEQLRYKKEAIQEAKAERRWHSFVYLHERPYRLHAFQQIKTLMPDDEYWSLLASIWIDSENIRQNSRAWFTLLRSKRNGKYNMMSEEARAALAAMPVLIPVYQGHTVRRHDGWSWTTERSTAVWFAQRFSTLEHSGPVLTTGTVSKADVLAYLTNRGEAEILVDRRKVTIIAVKRLAKS